MFVNNDDVDERNFFFFVLKILLLIGLNLLLSENFEKFNNLTNVILFNAGAVALWFASWLDKTSRLYQKNLRHLPTTAKSAETPESRRENALNRKWAMKQACRGIEIDMRDLQW